MVADRKEEQWYSNKDLLEKLLSLGGELAELRMILRKYNGLQEKIGGIETTCAARGEILRAIEKFITQVETANVTRRGSAADLRLWSGWAVVIIGLVAKVLKWW